MEANTVSHESISCPTSRHTLSKTTKRYPAPTFTKSKKKKNALTKKKEIQEFMEQRSKISDAPRHGEFWGEKIISHSLIFWVKWTAISGRIIVWTKDFIINPEGLADPGSRWGLIRYEEHKALLSRCHWKEASNLDSELVSGLWSSLHYQPFSISASQ